MDRRTALPRPLLVVIAVAYVVAVAGLTTGPQPPSRFDIVGNLVLFVPFGALLSLAAPRLLQLWVVVAAFACASAIEAAQLFVLTERDASWNDIALNTAGAALGCVLGQTLLAAIAWVHRRRRRPR